MCQIKEKFSKVLCLLNLNCNKVYKLKSAVGLTAHKVILSVLWSQSAKKEALAFRENNLYK